MACVHRSGRHEQQGSGAFHGKSLQLRFAVLKSAAVNAETAHELRPIVERIMAPINCKSESRPTLPLHEIPWTVEIRPMEFRCDEFVLRGWIVAG